LRKSAVGSPRVGGSTLLLRAEDTYDA